MVMPAKKSQKPAQQLFARRSGKHSITIKCVPTLNARKHLNQHDLGGRIRNGVSCVNCIRTCSKVRGQDWSVDQQKSGLIKHPTRYLILVRLLCRRYQAGKEKGRGLKAAKDIKKGDMIFKATNNTVVFTDGHSFRKFMFMLNERFPSFACDVLQWAWVQDLEGGAFGIEVDLDDCNLLNSGHRSANIQCGKADDICDGSHFYARRDIKKGEEILGSYSEFVSDHSWSELGL
mmetsp:Transcript_1579/g.2354  ORF Transcript_1579/g.2354 Transcript_1579/m.2354 type:complete len:232 (+) Transcript_1579:165-860(+)